MKFLTHRVSLQSSHANFQKKFVSQKMAAILNCRIVRKIAKHKGKNWEKVSLFPSSDFIAKNQLAKEDSQVCFR